MECCMNLKSVEIFGDRLLLRPTFDIIDYVGGVGGFDIYDEDKNFITHYDVDNQAEVELQIQRDCYRVAI